ncbi:MAG TPA: nuclear transport factor 2 family protein [Anaerolineales bacterium]|nr:nuclear transport factor 2 family protein [Anaerolineales bacterium]
MNIKAKLLVLFIVLAQVLAGCANSLSAAAGTPTAAPTPTSDPLLSAKIVQAFWDALEAGDLEKAMTYVGDDIECRVYCHLTGKATFQTYMQGYLNAGYLTRISDVKVVGSIVTYSWEVYRNGNFLRRGEDDEMMQVDDGKIVYWENYHR